MYYPKSKILTNQYTPGGEYIIKSTGLNYNGYYYILSNNKAFSGKNPNDTNSEELVPQEQNNTQNSVFIVPYPYYPVASENDYKLGFITRYFIKKRNMDYTNIIEISKNDYDKNINYFNSNTSLYNAIKIHWRLGSNKQEISNINQKLVKLKENIFPGFSYFFKDFIGPF